MNETESETLFDKTVSITYIDLNYQALYGARFCSSILYVRSKRMPLARPLLTVPIMNSVTTLKDYAPVNEEYAVNEVVRCNLQQDHKDSTD
jgi:hypothetical protein